MTLRIIYEPRGRALEYAPLAVSLYRGCPHGCVYCFAPASTKTEREKFLQPYARKDALAKLAMDCADLKKAGDEREILLSFTTDPYQPLEEGTNLTRKAIIVLCRYGRPFTILTKGGLLSSRDFDWLGNYKDLARYGTTLVFSNEKDRVLWEPLAAPTRERIAALELAHHYGIRTWVSLEPVIYPVQSLFMITATFPFVDEYRIGKFNHTKDNPALEKFIESIGYVYPTDQEWTEFVQQAYTLLKFYKKEFVFKKDLQPYLPIAQAWGKV